MHCITYLGIARFWYRPVSMSNYSRFTFFIRDSRVSMLVVVRRDGATLGTMVMAMRA